MSTFAAASTPSPPSHLHSPATPKHGYSDPWEPYSPRKSARLSAQRASSSSAATARTPSPKASHHMAHQHQSHNHYLRSPRSARRDYGDNTMSPAPSPRKKKTPAMDSVRRASGTLTAESTASAAASLGLSASKVAEPYSGRAAISARTGMLPTPAKTPSKKHPSAENEANIAAIARNLFHTDEDVMPSSSSKKKRAKKYTGLTLDSFTAVEEPITIFTDSNERIPEADNSVDNPFYGAGAAAPLGPAPRRSKRKQVSVPGEGRTTIEEASRREDGLVYVFRGKKIFRKFEDEASSQGEGQDDEEAAVETKRSTRSSIKPRLLFPPSKNGKEAALDEDEEAATDIEEDVAKEAGNEEPETPTELAEAPATPSAPKFAPASPPVTGRTTRSANKLAQELSPMKPPRRGKRSPFDGWRQTKSSTSSAGHKRPAEDLGTTAPAAKRSRA